MDIKGELATTWASKKFEGATFDCNVVDSRLNVTVHVRGSVDLPGDLDAVVANVFGLLGMGNSQKPLPTLPS